jgi:hypothetical protein
LPLTPQSFCNARVVNATPSFQTLFGAPPSSEAGFWPALCTDTTALAKLFAQALGCDDDDDDGDGDGDEVLGAAVVAAGKSGEAKGGKAEPGGGASGRGNSLGEEATATAKGSLRFRRPSDGTTRLVSVKTVRAPGVMAAQSMLLVCHDLTDFQRGVELQVNRSKDVEAIQFLSHELQNRFIALRGLVDDARAAIDNDDGAARDRALSDTNAGLDRGVFLCTKQDVSLQLADGSYGLYPRPVDIEAALVMFAEARKMSCGDVVVDPRLPKVGRCTLNSTDRHHRRLIG